MRTVAWWLAGSLALVALGCSGGGSTPTAPSTTGSGAVPTAPNPVTSASAALGTPTQSGLLHQSALAIYTIDVDPGTLTATSRLKETRTGQANDDLYLLSIDSFLNAGSFKITGVSATATTVDLAYAVAHPFPAPNNPTGTPNGSTNRADLGVAGMVLFLADVGTATGNTYFTDRVANTELVANADAYYSPGGLLTTSGTANTYPYKQLVDESLDPRSGVSNGGDVTGNFGSDGWTRSEFGAGNNGWTGYGVMHQGQTVSNTVSFDKAALSGGFSLDVSIIALYNDPRGGATPAQKKANRLPPASPDASLFAYRMPHGALDVGKITVLPETAGFIANTISAQTMSFLVEDWDARATESAEADLAADSSFTNVAQGESGTPTLEVCIPDVLGDATVTADASTVVDDDSGVGGDVDQDSGRPGDALYYSTLVTKAAGSGQGAGDYKGMVRAIDPQVGLTIGLDESLAPLPSTPDPVTYQALTVELLPDNDPPTATVNGPGAAVASGNGVLTITVSAYNDPDGDPIQIRFDWNNDGDFDDTGEGFQTLDGTPPDSFNSPIFYNNATLAADGRSVPYEYTDGVIASPIAGSVNWTLGPNQAPVVTGNRVLATAALTSPALFTMNAGTGTATDPEGDTVSYTITNNRNGDSMTFSAFPNAANTTAITNPPHATVAFTVYANDALHPTTSGTAYPVVNGTINPAVPTGWVYTPLVSTTGQEIPRTIATDTAGNVYIAGNRATTTGALDFGGGARAIVGTTIQHWLVKLDANGNYVWDRVWGSTGSFGRVFGVDTDNAGNVYVSGCWSSPLLVINGLGGGAVDQTAGGSGVEDLYILKFDGSGNYQAIGRTNDAVDWWQLIPVGASTSSTAYGPAAKAMVVNKATGDVYHIGSPSSTGGILDFGGGVTLTLGGGRSAPLVKYNSSLVAQWAVDLAVAPSNLNTQYATCVDLDPSGNPYVGGTFATNIDLGAGTVAVIGGQDAFIVGRSAATGAYIAGSARTFGSSSTGSEQVSSLSIDSTGIYVTGTWANGVGQTMSLGAPLGTMASAGLGNGFIGRYTLANVPVWQLAMTGSSYNIVASGEISSTDFYVSGHFSNSTSNWGYGAITIPSTAPDMILAKYEKLNGTLTGYNRVWGTTGTTEYGAAIAVQPTGDPVMTGQWGGTSTVLDWDPGAGVVNRTSVGGGDIYAVKLLAGPGTF